MVGVGTTTPTQWEPALPCGWIEHVVCAGGLEVDSSERVIEGELPLPVNLHVRPGALSTPLNACVVVPTE